MKISLAYADGAMPRTVFYDAFVKAVQRHAAFVPDPAGADMLFPAEDTALETNWPRYGDNTTAFIRGKVDGGQYFAYLERISSAGRPVCLLSMDPSIHVPMRFVTASNVFVADGSLPIWERVANPRTISMPALPIVVSTAPEIEKTLLASFRGVMSHPCRAALKKLHDGKEIICEIVEPENHNGRLDAQTGKGDLAFSELMARSVFAFIPRGDALFSYRLLEAMSFGCIPIVLSDGWVLPFDRTIDWQNTALTVPEALTPALAKFLRQLPPARIAQMQQTVKTTYDTFFHNLDSVVAGLVAELGRIVA